MDERGQRLDKRFRDEVTMRYLDVVKSLLESESRGIDPYIEIRFGTFDGAVYDYRLDSVELSNCCIPITFFPCNCNQPVASATLLCLDAHDAKKQMLLKAKKGGYQTVEVAQIVHPPLILLGYAEFYTNEMINRLRIIRWYVSLMRKLCEKGFSLYLEICGTRLEETTSIESPGGINPRSRSVCSLVRLLDMKKVENCYEPNTLGPVFYREPVAPSRLG